MATRKNPAGNNGTTTTFLKNMNDWTTNSSLTSILNRGDLYGFMQTLGGKAGSKRYWGRNVQFDASEVIQMSLQSNNIINGDDIVCLKFDTEEVSCQNTITDPTVIFFMYPDAFPTTIQHNEKTYYLRSIGLNNGSDDGQSGVRSGHWWAYVHSGVSEDERNGWYINDDDVKRRVARRSTSRRKVRNDKKNEKCALYSLSLDNEVGPIEPRGMSNLGNTCFFNTACQMILAVPQLRTRIGERVTAEAARKAAEAEEEEAEEEEAARKAAEAEQEKRDLEFARRLAQEQEERRKQEERDREFAIRLEQQQEEAKQEERRNSRKRKRIALAQQEELKEAKRIALEQQEELARLISERDKLLVQKEKYEEEEKSCKWLITNLIEQEKTTGERSIEGRRRINKTICEMKKNTNIQKLNSDIAKISEQISVLSVSARLSAAPPQGSSSSGGVLVPFGNNNPSFGPI